MGTQSPVQGLAQDFRNRREGYLLRYLGAAFAVVLTGAAIWRGSSVLTTVGLILFFSFSAALLLHLWTGQRLFKTTVDSTSKSLYQMSQARPFDHLLSVDLGLHNTALAISKHLTSGRLVVVDVHNPQLAPGKSLARARMDSAQVPDDPRTVWYNGSVDLLPLPDHSVRAVFMDRVLSELVQAGDRLALLREVHRVLEPNGRVLIAELAESWPNRLRAFPGDTPLHPTAYWIDLLATAGLEVNQQENLHDLVICLRADKVSPYGGRQLALELEFPPS